MRDEMVATRDGLALARDVREVATRARLTLMRPADPAEARDLLETIVSLERASAARSSGDLARWLRSLRGRVESHGAQVPRD